MRLLIRDLQPSVPYLRDEHGGRPILSGKARHDFKYAPDHRQRAAKRRFVQYQ